MQVVQASADELDQTTDLRWKMSIWPYQFHSVIQQLAVQTGFLCLLFSVFSCLSIAASPHSPSCHKLQPDLLRKTKMSGNLHS